MRSAFDINHPINVVSLTVWAWKGHYLTPVEGSISSTLLRVQL